MKFFDDLCIESQVYFQPKQYHIVIVPDPRVDINVFYGLASVHQKDINSDAVIPAEPSSCDLIHAHNPTALQKKNCINLRVVQLSTYL